MACESSPTRTAFTTVTVVGESTSVSATVSTAPETVSTSFVVSCATLGLLSSCETSTSVHTILGGVTTLQVPFTVDVPVTVTQPVSTLFASCSDSQSPPPSSTTSFSMIQSTPPPTVFTSESSSTRADGSVVILTQTITSTLPATAVWVPTVVPVNQQRGNNSSRSVNLGPIIGGVIGGFLGLIAIVALLWILLRRRPSWGDIFEAEDPYVPTPIRTTRDKKRRVELDMDALPKPYQYGLVGQVPAATLTSPPASPTSAQQTLSTQAPTWHGRQRSSLTPLLVPSTASSPGTSMPTTASSRPSTAGSFSPNRPTSQYGQYPPNARPQVDEFGAQPRPTSVHSQPVNGSWNRPVNPTLINNVAERPLSAIVDGRGSPVSFQEPRRALHIANAPLSPTDSMNSSTIDLNLPQPNESTSPQVGSPLGPNAGQLRSSIVSASERRIDPEVVITAPSAPPSYEA